MLLAALTIAVLLLGGVSAVASEAPAPATSAGPICDIRTHDPHWSANGGTVVAKMTWSCPAGSSVDSYEMKLYVCSYKPFLDLGGWRCTLKTLKQTRTGGPLTGSGTRYIPETGKKVRGCGNWFVNAFYVTEGWGFGDHSPHYIHDCTAP
jgi:hypothetical protein